MVQREEISKDNAERDDLSNNKSRAFRIIEERMERRRRRASLGRLIFYIIALILVIFLMLWFKRVGG